MTPSRQRDDAPRGPVLIRPAQVADAGAMLAIYAPIVERTAISFEAVPPSLGEFQERIRHCSTRWLWLAAELDGRIAGYAYGSAHRERAAYRWSTETTVYVAADSRRQGVATALYRALLPGLAARGLCNAFAGVALPNRASVALHERVGFNVVGTFPAVGHKLGRWHDVQWLHARLREGPPALEA